MQNTATVVYFSEHGDNIVAEKRLFRINALRRAIARNGNGKCPITNKLIEAPSIHGDELAARRFFCSNVWHNDNVWEGTIIPNIQWDVDNEEKEDNTNSMLKAIAELIPNHRRGQRLRPMYNYDGHLELHGIFSAVSYFVAIIFSLAPGRNNLVALKSSKRYAELFRLSRGPLCQELATDGYGYGERVSLLVYTTLGAIKQFLPMYLLRKFNGQRAAIAFVMTEMVELFLAYVDYETTIAIGRSDVDTCLDIAVCQNYPFSSSGKVQDCAPTTDGADFSLTAFALSHLGIAAGVTLLGFLLDHCQYREKADVDIRDYAIAPR